MVIAGILQGKLYQTVPLQLLQQGHTDGTLVCADGDAASLALFPGHALGEDLALNDLVGALSRHHHEAREFLATAGAFEIARCAVVDDARLEALDQPAAPAFTVFVEQGAAAGAEDRDGANVLARHLRVCVVGGWDRLARCTNVAGRTKSAAPARFFARFGGHGRLRAALQPRLNMVFSTRSI